MTWLIYILISVFLGSFIGLFDKFFCNKKIKNIYSFAFLINLIYLPINILVTFYLRKTIVFGIPFLLSLLSGAAFFLTWIFWWKALTFIETSRASAISSSQPVINAIFAMIFLNEFLTGEKWIAVILIITGAVLVTWEKNKSSGSTKGYLFVLFAVFFGAIGNLILKGVTRTMPALTANSLAFYVSFPLYCIFLFNKNILREVKDNLQNSKNMGLLVVRGLIGYVMIGFFALAIGSGPIALVTAINGASPAVVFVLAIVMSIFWPKIIKEELTRQTLLIKSFAIILIIIGVVIISF